MQLYVIRPATDDDVDAIAWIWYSAWGDGHAGHVPDELYAHRTAETFPPRVRERIPHTFVAEVSGQVVGMVSVRDDELEELFVDAGARGTGVAQALIATGEKAIAAAGHARAWLAVVEGNARARAFYERGGWHDAGPLEYQAETASGPVTVPSRRYEKALTPGP
jgi:putative acetyltransferase